MRFHIRFKNKDPSVCLCLIRTSMTSTHLALQELSASSAKAGTWMVRVQLGFVETYEYMNRKQEKVSAKAFKCLLVGETSTEYVAAVFKGSNTAVTAAKGRFGDGSVWVMSKVAFDKTDAVHISASIKLLVLLSGSTVMNAVAAASQGQCAAPSMMPEPRPKISDIMELTGAAAFDCLGLLQECSDTRQVETSRGSRTVFNIVISDDSGADRQTKNELVINVWAENDAHHVLLNPMAPCLAHVTRSRNVAGFNLRFCDVARWVR